METERLQLYEMVLSDITSLSAMLQDENVMYAYNGAFNDDETMAWMEKQLRRYRDYGFGLWAVFLKGTDKMIGQCGITMQEYNMAQVPEIGYLFAHEYWHKGYAYSIIRDTNIASQNVARRMGMHPIDTIVKHYRGVDMPHIVFCTIVKKNKA